MACPALARRPALGPVAGVVPGASHLAGDLVPAHGGPVVPTP